MYAKSRKMNEPGERAPRALLVACPCRPAVGALVHLEAGRPLRVPLVRLVVHVREVSPISIRTEAHHVDGLLEDRGDRLPELLLTELVRVLRVVRQRGLVRKS